MVQSRLPFTYSLMESMGLGYDMIYDMSDRSEGGRWTRPSLNVWRSVTALGSLFQLLMVRG